MARITISVDGVPQFRRFFERVDASFRDLTPIWPDVRDEFYRIETEQFDSEGGKGATGSWQALSARYAAQKIKRFPGKKIMEASGLLRGSLVGPGSGSVYQTTPKQIVIGTEVPYGVYHQRGGGRLPKREIISMSDMQKIRLSKVIQKGLVRELRKGVGYLPVSERSF